MRNGPGNCCAARNDHVSERLAMSFAIAEECVALGLRAGVILFRDLHIEPTSPALRAEIAREVEQIRSRFKDVQEVRALPEVVAYQELLRKVGVNPRRE